MRYYIFLLAISSFYPNLDASSTLINPFKKTLEHARMYKERYAQIIDLLQAEDRSVNQEQKKELRRRSINEISQLIHDTELLVRALSLYRSEEARVCVESLVPQVRLMKQKMLSLSLSFEQEKEHACAQDARDMIALCGLQEEVYDSFSQDPLSEKYRNVSVQVICSYAKLIEQSVFSSSQILEFLTVCTQQLELFRSAVSVENRRERAGRQSLQVKCDQLGHEIKNVAYNLIKERPNISSNVELRKHLLYSCLTIKNLFGELLLFLGKATTCTPSLPEGFSYSVQLAEKSVQEALCAMPQQKHEPVAQAKTAGVQYQQELGLFDQFACAQARAYKGTAGLLRSVAGGVSTVKKVSQDAASLVISAGDPPDEITGLFDLAAVPSGARTAISFLYWCRENSANPLGYLGNAMMKAFLPASFYTNLFSGTSCQKGSLELIEQRVAQKVFSYIDMHKTRLKFLLQNNNGDVLVSLNTFAQNALHAAEELEKKSFNQIRSTIKPESLFFMLDEISTATREQEAPAGSFLALFAEANKKSGYLNNVPEENPVDLVRPLFFYTLIGRKRFLQNHAVPEELALSFCKEYVTQTDALKKDFADLLADAQYQHEQLRILGVPSHPVERLSDYRKLEKSTWDYWLPCYTQALFDKKNHEQLLLRTSLEQEKLTIKNKQEKLVKERFAENSSWLARIKALFLFKNTEEKIESIAEQLSWHEAPVNIARINELTNERDDARDYLVSYTAKQSWLSALFNYGRLGFLKKELQKKESELAIALKNNSIKRLSDEISLCNTLIQALPLRADLSQKEEQFVKKMGKIAVISDVFS